jgi:hypothetical protein
LMVYSECRDDGEMSDPSVSVPMAIGARPAATAIPDPDEEPPVLSLLCQNIPDM